MLFFVLLGMLALIQAWDVWCSYDILTKHGREKNPLVQWFINKIGILPGLILVKVVFVLPAVIVLYVFRWHPYAIWVLAALDIYYLIILRSYVKRSI